MEWLKKYWIVPVIIIVVIGVYIYLTKNSTSVTTGEVDELKFGDLENNDSKFENFGLQVTFNANRNAILIKAQGNGNATEFEWTRDRDVQFHHLGDYTIGMLSEIPDNHNLLSSDGDFALNIRSVSYASQQQYCVISIWDPGASAVDPMNPQASKAAVQVSWTDKTITVIKSAPFVGKK